MNQETSFALLGALIAVAIVLFALVVFGGVMAVRVVGYVARFKGFQGNRNAKNEMTFTAVVDETPQAPPPPFEPIDREPPSPEALN